MSVTGLNTLDKIQKEIKETLEREDELKNGYIDTHSNSNGNFQFNHKDTDSKPINGFQKKNGLRRLFTPNSNTKGVMQKFFKSRGKGNLSPLKANQNGWISDTSFQPAKISVEKDKPLRNGFVPAEEKIAKELQDFQLREAELRNERRKSQPNLMAALELEECELEYRNGNHDFVDFKLKPAKSMACLYKPEDVEIEENHSAPSSLKPARSLAALCDVSDDNIEMPGTYSLIMQFESLKDKDARS